MVPVIHVLSLLVFSKLFAGFLVHHLSKRLPSGMTAMQTNLMQCAAYGLSTDRLTPHLLNLCSNAGSTHTSISHTSITQPLDMTRSTCTQLLWSTMARPVLSGTCPVKPLYGLGHRAAAQFQGLGNLLIAYTIFMSNKSFFFRSSESYLPWGAMLNFQWPVWESESDNNTFNTPAPHSHLRPFNMNEWHGTEERKWLMENNGGHTNYWHFGPNLDIFT